MTTKKGQLLSRADLLTPAEFKIEKVEIDEIGNFVYIREMTGQQRDKYDHSLYKIDPSKKGGVDYDMQQHNVKLLVMAICDENGELIFKTGDYGTLSRGLKSKQVNILVNAIRKLNGIDKEEREMLTKNSEGVQDAK